MLARYVRDGELFVAEGGSSATLWQESRGADDRAVMDGARSTAVRFMFD
jgi:hypothetical protein